MPHYRIVAWKNRLMKKLNDGIMNIEEWDRFITEAQSSNCEAIADDMRKRLEYYAGIIKQQTGA